MRELQSPKHLCYCPLYDRQNTSPHHQSKAATQHGQSKQLVLRVLSVLGAFLSFGLPVSWLTCANAPFISQALSGNTQKWRKMRHKIQKRCDD